MTRGNTKQSTNYVLSRKHKDNKASNAYVFEPPGETHTLTVPDGVDEMITFFHVTGCLYYVDPDGNPLGYDDVFTLIEDCRAHYEKVGLGAGFVDQFIR